MSSIEEPAHVSPPPVAIRDRMIGRDIGEAHRVFTPLELLFDLSAVVAVAAATAQLHERLSEGKFKLAATGFVMSFFAVWWPWASFTWFSSAYDTDDVPFRLSTMVQIIGVLFIAAGMIAADPLQTAGVVGFSLMRFAHASQWLRAGAGDRARRTTCLVYALSICLLQILWIARAIWVPVGGQFVSFLVLVPLELFVPFIAARFGETPWHAHHVAERYGLFTIILLGECMASVAAAISRAINSLGWSLDLMALSLGTVGLLLGLWWAYFLVPFGQVLHYRRERGYFWAFGHVLVFSSLAILGGALALVADALPVPAGGATRAGAVPLAQTPLFALGLAAAASTLFLGALWWLGRRTTRRQAQSFGYFLPQPLVADLAVAAVALGLSLPWGLLILACGPTIMIGWIVFCRYTRPEAFAVR